MTEDEKHEIATLASDLNNKWQIYQAHAMTNPLTFYSHVVSFFKARKKVATAYAIAETEYLEAKEAFTRAQKRIAEPVGAK